MDAIARLKSGPPNKSSLFKFELWMVVFVAIQVIFCATVPTVFAYEYILASLVLGVFLFNVARPKYYYFSFLIWSFTPLFRRIVDLQVGWNPNNIILPLPLAVSSLTLFSLLKFNRVKGEKLVMPLLLLGVALIYAFGLGMVTFGFLPALYELGLWCVPIIFGLSILVYDTESDEIFDAIYRFFRSYLVIGGAYGVFQFVIPPLWDAYWMLNVPLTSIGYPMPYMVRVFSTLNSPGVFAQFIMVSLLLASENKSNLKWPGLIVGYSSFLLSMVRSAWGGWILAYIGMAGSVKLTNLYRFALSLLALVAVIYASSFVEPIGQIIDKRLSTLTNLEDDVSFRARIYQYEAFFNGMTNDPFGIGFGNASNSGRLGERTRVNSFQNIDSGIANLVSIYGWIGSLLYIGGLGLLFTRKTVGIRVFSDQGLTACAFAVVIQSIFFNVFIGPVGILLWTFTFMRLGKSPQEGSLFKLV